MPAPASPQTVIARGVGSNALSFVLRFAARAGFLFIGAKLFGATSYGVFTLAVAVVELAVPVASLGLKRMVFPWLEEEAASRGAMHVLLDALALATIAGSLVALFIVSLSELLPGAMISHQLRLALLVLGPAVMGQVTADIALATTRWTHAMRYEVTARGAVEPYVATAVTLAAWYAGFSTTGLLIGYWAGTIALVGFSLWSARHCLGPFGLLRWRPDLEASWQRVRRLLPASGSDLVASFAQRVDLYLVGLLLGDAAAGMYGVVRQLRTPILQVRQAFDGILTPLIARTMRADGDVAAGEATAAATRVVLTAQLGIVLLMIAAGDSLLGLFGRQYIAAYAALVAMAMGEAVNGAFGLSELIIYYRRPALALALNVVLIAIIALLIPLLAPRMGIAGASTATLIAALCGAALRRHWLRRFGVLRDPLHAALPMAAALVAGLAGYAVQQSLNEVAGLPVLFDKLSPPIVALGLYAVAIRAWVRWQPTVLSLARFRVA
ncbi:lipopolysaccharide biosynthesis protein [Novosphingobium lentum]|uniref:lipopolysaccharide biosynthesis protein n=1 Tax=Novosphingobium lentum TaxID=145287 RepID=UPI0008353367|nr:oligosaccharide flippase family protein [Novosphingobium lentum]